MQFVQSYYEKADEDYEYMNPMIVQYVTEMIAYLENLSTNYDKLYQKFFDFELTQTNFGNFKRASFDMQTSLVQLVNFI
jgi:hypothetical protein